MSAAVAFVPNHYSRVHLNTVSLKGYSLHCSIFATATDKTMENDGFLEYSVDIFPQTDKIPWIYSHGQAKAKMLI
jgi:hypothetical protein